MSIVRRQLKERCDAKYVPIEVDELLSRTGESKNTPGNRPRLCDSINIECRVDTDTNRSAQAHTERKTYIHLDRVDDHIPNSARTGQRRRSVDYTRRERQLSSRWVRHEVKIISESASVGDVLELSHESAVEGEDVCVGLYWYAKY